jgi:selenocysteine-specific translation elongation factor
MTNINVALLGDNEFAEELGKKGTTSDFTFYNYKKGDITITFMVPTAYPDKLQSLTHVLALADTAIVVIKKLDRDLGEYILALDLLEIKGGLIIFDEYVEKEKFIKMVMGTVLETFIIVDKKPPEIYSRLEKMMEKMTVKQPLVEHVIVDSAFNVKSVGTVVLGVSRGNFSVHDELRILPNDKRTSIRSIQVHDVDVKSAHPGERVGFALKGIPVDDVERGSILARIETEGLYNDDSISGKWKQSQYFTEKIENGTRLFIAAGLQYRPAVVTNIEGDKITLKVDKKIGYVKGSRFLILTPERKMRIAGVIEL